MPVQWTGELIGEMHLKDITEEQLAEEVGWKLEYLSAVLSGRCEPKEAERRLQEALTRLEIQTERERKGLSTDWKEVIEEYRKFLPGCTDRFIKALGLDQETTDE